MRDADSSTKAAAQQRGASLAPRLVSRCIDLGTINAAVCCIMEGRQATTAAAARQICTQSLIRSA